MIYVDWTFYGYHDNKDKTPLNDDERLSLYNACEYMDDEPDGSTDPFIAKFYTTSINATETMEKNLTDWTAAHPDIVIEACFTYECEESPTLLIVCNGKIHTHKGRVVFDNGKTSVFVVTRIDFTENTGSPHVSNDIFMNYADAVKCVAEARESEESEGAFTFVTERDEKENIVYWAAARDNRFAYECFLGEEVLQ